MSTRCMIKFISPFKKAGKMTTREVVLYHHHDGYPTGVGLGLMDFIKPLREQKKKYPKSTPDCDGELIKIGLETGNKNLDEIYWKKFHNE